MGMAEARRASPIPLFPYSLTPSMMQRKLGPFEVAPIGLGCMNLSHAYGAPPPVAESERIIARAIEGGVSFFDTAALYGFGA